MSEAEPVAGPKQSLLYREQDDRLYLALASYGILTLILLLISFGSIMGYVLIATALPVIALIVLTCHQATARRRPSPLAFSLVFAATLGIACSVLLIAAQASAAV